MTLYVVIIHLRKSTVFFFLTKNANSIDHEIVETGNEPCPKKVYIVLLSTVVAKNLLVGCCIKYYFCVSDLNLQSGWDTRGTLWKMSEYLVSKLPLHKLDSHDANTISGKAMIVQL